MCFLFLSWIFRFGQGPANRSAEKLDRVTTDPVRNRSQLRRRYRSCPTVDQTLRTGFDLPRFVFFSHDQSKAKRMVSKINKEKGQTFSNFLSLSLSLSLCVCVYETRGRRFLESGRHRRLFLWFQRSPFKKKRERCRLCDWRRAKWKSEFWDDCQVGTSWDSISRVCVLFCFVFIGTRSSRFLIGRNGASSWRWWGALPIGVGSSNGVCGLLWPPICTTMAGENRNFRPIRSAVRPFFPNKSDRMKKKQVAVESRNEIASTNEKSPLCSIGSSSMRSNVV